jgi:hypothetical protein
MRDGSFEKSDFTDPPGEVVPPSRREELVRKFRRAFREGRMDPIWPDYYPTNLGFHDARIADESVFDDPALAGRVVYFYDERREWVCRTDAGRVRRFLEVRNPWEDHDYYVFDESWRWCIAVTHEDDVMVIGDPGGRGS